MFCLHQSLGADLIAISYKWFTILFEFLMIFTILWRIGRKYFDNFWDHFYHSNPAKPKVKQFVFAQRISIDFPLENNRTTWFFVRCDRRSQGKYFLVLKRKLPSIRCISISKCQECGGQKSFQVVCQLAILFYHHWSFIDR